MPKTYMQGLSSDFEQFFLVKKNLLTSVHNDTDNADNADDTDDYNRVIGIAQLKTFSCAKDPEVQKATVDCVTPCDMQAKYS